MKLKAVFDSIILKPVEQDEELIGSLIIPDLGKEKHITADVLDVGPGRPSFMTGEIIKPSIKVGDRVLLPKVGVTELETDEGEFLACEETKVLAIIKKEE